MDKLSNIINIPAISDPVGAIVALHGWGANAEDLANLAPAFNVPNYLMLFPEAPFDRPNVQGGKMWYDFQDITSTQLQVSKALLKSYLESLTEMGIPIFLLGFSQGAAMTLDVGLEFNLAGLICLSGYLHPTITKTASTSPILIIHGNQDPVVPIIAAQSAKATLTKMGAKVTYAEFAMGHEINGSAIATVRTFILKNTV
jgi:phospholipase/carboxylesterase